VLLAVYLPVLPQAGHGCAAARGARRRRRRREATARRRRCGEAPRPGAAVSMLPRRTTRRAAKLV